jgi:ABC-type lipopolysaccharide export system ATPase subunit
MPAQPLLQVLDLSKRFGDRKALDKVSLTVKPGEIVGVLGRNGAGKTTLFKSLMDLLLPDEGEIHVWVNATYVAQEPSQVEDRRLEISRAISTRPALLLLDEPFSGVDPIQVQQLKRLILDLPRQGTGVLLADHNAAETLGICDRAYILHEGRILAHGTPGELSKG